MIFSRFLYINETLINQLLVVQHVSFLSIDIFILTLRVPIYAVITWTLHVSTFMQRYSLPVSQFSDIVKSRLEVLRLISPTNSYSLKWSEFNILCRMSKLNWKPVYGKHTLIGTTVHYFDTDASSSVYTSIRSPLQCGINSGTNKQQWLNNSIIQAKNSLIFELYFFRKTVWLFFWVLWCQIVLNFARKAMLFAEARFRRDTFYNAQYFAFAHVH